MACVLRGPNGSGKTTLLRLIAGVLLPTAGEIRLYGKPLDPVRNFGRIGFLPEPLRGLYENLSGWENLFFFGKLCGLTGSEIQKRADRLKEALGAQDFLDLRVRELSQGLKTRLNLTRLLVQDPEIFLLDEPFQHLDFETLKRVKDWFGAELLLARKKIILLASHGAQEFSDWEGKSVFLKNGRIENEQPLERLLSVG